MSIDDDFRRVTLTLPAGVALALDRLSKLHRLSHAEMLSRLVTQADDAILVTIKSDADLDKYLAIKKIALQGH